MIKRMIQLAVGTLLMVCGASVQAQQPAKIPRIGYLTGAYLSAITARTQAFRQGLNDLGYVEGKNIFIEWRSAEAKLDRLPALAAELVRLKVEIIVTGGAAATRPAKEATSTIPIVMTQDDDPVATGFVASLARPGSNITGLSTLAPERSGKRLELLKEAVPKVTRVAILRNPKVSTHIDYGKEAERAAKSLGVSIQFAELQARNDKSLEDALGALLNERVNALLVTPCFSMIGSSRLLNLPRATSCRESILPLDLLSRVVLCRTPRVVATFGVVPLSTSTRSSKASNPLTFPSSNRQSLSSSST